MSLLSPNQPNFEPNALDRQVTNLRRGPRQMIEQFVNNWENLFDLLWSERGGVTPAQRLEALGTDGGELMLRSGAAVTFILTQLKDVDQAIIDRITEKVSNMPAITVDEDGIVTIDDLEDED